MKQEKSKARYWVFKNNPDKDGPHHEVRVYDWKYTRPSIIIEGEVIPACILLVIDSEIQSPLATPFGQGDALYMKEKLAHMWNVSEVETEEELGDWLLKNVL